VPGGRSERPLRGLDMCTGRDQLIYVQLFCGKRELRPWQLSLLVRGGRCQARCVMRRWGCS
jgi:hypothetical protein